MTERVIDKAARAAFESVNEGQGDWDEVYEPDRVSWRQAALAVAEVLDVPLEALERETE